MKADAVNRLELKGITKAFPGVLANDAVSFAVKPGEIHALLGENGAGKSTLVKMIYGIMQPDAGEIVWNGETVHVANPKAARKMGVGMVFFNARSIVGWLLTLGCVTALIFGVISAVRFNLRTMTAFELIVILVLAVGGLGLFLRSLRALDAKYS